MVESKGFLGWGMTSADLHSEPPFTTCKRHTRPRALPLGTLPRGRRVGAEPEEHAAGGGGGGVAAPTKAQSMSLS